MLELRRLRLLRELHQRGTITAVARALNFSPSAVSQQLAILEREASVPLLEPVGRRVRLTPQGEILVGHADAVLAELERAESALANSVHSTAGTLRVAAFQTAVLALMPAVLIRLGAECPDLRVEVTEREPESALPAMVAGDYDLVIAEEYPGNPLPRPPQIERRDLMADELLLATPISWPGGSLRELRHRPFAMEPPGSPAGQWALAACRAAGFEPDVRYTTTDLQIHLRLVEAQLAAAMVPELTGVRDRGSVAVRRLPGGPVRQILAAFRRGASEHPAIRAFITAAG